MASAVEMAPLRKTPDVAPPVQKRTKTRDTAYSYLLVLPPSGDVSTLRAVFLGDDKVGG